MPRHLATLVLVFCTMLWGFAFIAQKTAMDSMGPLTFAGVRYLLGGFVILPLAIWEFRRKSAASVRLSAQKWREIAAVTVVFFLGSWLQQAGLLTTTVTNGGFLTGLYVFFVPVILLLVWRIRPHPMVWIGVPLALAGLYYLNGGSIDRLNSGDGLVIGSAVFWAMHVLLLGYLARTTGMPVFISGVSFLGAGALALGFAFALETPTIEGISGGWIEIVYAGVLSTAVSFTLQAVGQQYVPPANAAIILSGESLFAALGGAIILGERLPPIGYLGAALIFLAIVLVETVPILLARRHRPQAI
jgi:drug/metabolite transporter (DMT)-like permease